MVPILITILAFFLIIVNGYPLDVLDNVIDSRIVGGVPAPDGFAPYMAALVWGAPLKTFLCGGSIISTRHVLTAAHCIDPMVVNGELFASFHAVVGSNKWNSTSQIITFSYFENHPLWDSERVKNDIGILFITEELILNHRIAVVPLSFDSVDGDVPSYVTGWGRLGVKFRSKMVIFYPFADELQLLYSQTLSAERCSGIIDKSILHSTILLNSTLELCTLHSKGQGLCYGDSGSPLIDKATGHQIGIASWAFPCARGLPDVFVRISSFKEFLQQYI